VSEHREALVGSSCLQQAGVC